jgi:predicted enzyme related to lactoylglutathione lyase
MAVAEHAVHYLEIVTTDVRATADLYAKAHGWTFGPEAPELGQAVVAALPDGSLCGIRAPLSEQEKPLVRMYLRVSDLDAAVTRAAVLGRRSLWTGWTFPVAAPSPSTSSEESNTDCGRFRDRAAA